MNKFGLPCLEQFAMDGITDVVQYARSCITAVSRFKLLCGHRNDYNMSSVRISAGGIMYFFIYLDYMHNYSCSLKLETGYISIWDVRCHCIFYRGVPGGVVGFNDYIRDIKNLRGLAEIPAGILKLPERLEIAEESA